MALPERAKITKKNRLNNSMFKSFTNFFNREQSSIGELSHGQSNGGQSTSSTSLPPVTRATIAKLEQITSDFFQNSFSNKLASKPGLYSLQSLPARSQCLLTAQPDFQQYLCSSEKTTLKSGLRDVQIYVSTPTSLNNCSLCDTSLVHRLRQHVTNSQCDFNLIDLDSIFAASGQVNLTLRFYGVVVKPKNVQAAYYKINKINFRSFIYPGKRREKNLTAIRVESNCAQILPAAVRQSGASGLAEHVLGQVDDGPFPFRCVPVLRLGSRGS